MKLFNNPSLIKHSGIHADGWAAQFAAFELSAPKKPAALTLRGVVPLLGDQNFSTELSLLLDGQEIAEKTLKPNEFEVKVTALPTSSLTRRVEVRFSKLQKLSAADPRQIAALLHFIGFETPATDILAPGSNVQLGSGWQPVEIFGGEAFRWVTNDAEVTIKGDSCSLEIEPGPGLEVKPFELQALDRSGKVVGKASVRGREVIKLNATGTVKLHVEGGGKPAPKDPRILNFRVFQIW